MRAFLSVVGLVLLVAACAAPQPAVVIKPFTGHVPRIPGNYTAAARLPQAEPQPAQSASTSNSSQTSNLDQMQNDDRQYCANMVTPTHSSYHWCNKHDYPTKDRR
ncbi:hypothetical protein [Labrys neptuniae]